MSIPVRLLLLGLFFFQHSVYAQNDYEFPKGYVLNLEVYQGFSTNFDSRPELYLADIRLSPQLTVVEHALRVGLVSSLLYNNKKVSGAFGPHVAIKIKTFSVSTFNSSVANVQWMIENLWGTHQQRLLGTGLKTEIGQMLLVSFLGYRDYRLNSWRLQFGLGYNFIYNKVPDLSRR